MMGEGGESRPMIGRGGCGGSHPTIGEGVESRPMNPRGGEGGYLSNGRGGGESFL